MKGVVFACFLWFLKRPPLNAFCSEENKLFQFNIMQGQQKLKTRSKILSREAAM